MREFIKATGLTAVACMAAFAANAQGFPTKPIEIVVPYAAGGGTDLSIRVLADVLSRKLDGATVVVRNEPGGGGAIGTGSSLKARPDGYTLGTGAQGPIALLPHYGATTYDIDSVDFLALIARNLQIVLACADTTYKDFESFLAAAKENPGTVLVGNSGAGGANHLSMEAFGKVAGVTFEHVPYGGAAEALTSCAGGHIDAVTATPAEARPYVQAGTVTPLFVMEQDRIGDYPDVPTAVEKGIDFTWSSWKGIIAPKGIPDDVRARLTDALAAAMADPDFIQKMETMGEFVDYRDSEGFAALAREESTKAEQVIRDLGMYGMNKSE
ncbi:tripartite tricarboxylate transporter substrate binding protein [Rhizobiaceae bacterium BDR2-2]|uniref:Tripartite tricarboxylate transporter substrate binding protein n=1 Tax=Ectorhizobium quercum TaxID=2965071 RepID=A0AAE3N2A3_9HYPH|nr:tripartite tricarboxylate transporter substrate binding protein [Ectorhizobium quercum]MCX8997337.1 tripartite tricarboxylate transporter substrate binding protein [Ectorhizobium quercum]